jgi:hypothetical protein
LREAIQISPQALNYHSLLAQALSREGNANEAAKAMQVEADIRQQFLRDEQASRN